MNTSKIKALRNLWGGVTHLFGYYRKEASVRFVSGDLRERRSEVGRKEVTPYGC